MPSEKLNAAYDSIGFYWSDEELFMSLERMAKGSHLPNNVISDVNLYQYNPSNLPGDVWFYIPSEQKKDSEHGFWKAKGEESVIFSNSSISGLRTTLEYYVGQAPHAQRTNWLMQEYMIIQKGTRRNNNLKESSCLCRVFLSSGTSEEQKKQQKSDHAENIIGIYLHKETSVVPDAGSRVTLSSSQAKSSRGDNNEQSQTSDGHQHHHTQVDDLLDIDCLSRGDFLELDDLADPVSRSSSSDDSSIVTISSDECFDSLALLKDIEDGNDKSEVCKCSSFNYNVAASEPSEVVLQTVTLGSLIESNVSQSLGQFVQKRLSDKNITGNDIGTQNEKNNIKSASSSKKMATLSSTRYSIPKVEKKSSNGRMKKLKRKYLCFMPF